MSKNNKDLPQSFDEIIHSNEESKKGSKLYRAESLALSDDRIANLVNKTERELCDVIDNGKIDLNDTERVKERTIYYLKACETSSCFPSMSGWARSMGMSRNALYWFRNKNPWHKTTDWITLVHDAFSDILAESSLRNDCNSITAIFLQKSLYGLREQVEIINTMDSPPTEDAPISIEELKKKYCIDSLPVDNNFETALPFDD